MKSIREKHPKNKDKYINKILILHEIEDSVVTSEKLFEDENFLNKVDAVVFLFESNDAEQVEFVKKATNLFENSLQFVPFILI